jgi:hypothetical protein
MFLKLNKSLIPNNPKDVTKSPIWNTLISPCYELLDDIDDAEDNEDEEDDDSSSLLVESEEVHYTLILSLSISLCNNMDI